MKRGWIILESSRKKHMHLIYIISYDCLVNPIAIRRFGLPDKQRTNLILLVKHNAFQDIKNHIQLEKLLDFNPQNIGHHFFG